MTVINNIAKELSLPRYVFFMSAAPELADALPDFRSDKPVRSPKSRQTIEAIQLAEAVQKAVADQDVPGARQLPHFTAKTDAEIDAFALEARRFFDITLEDQRDTKDAKSFYTLCRKKIEDAGIFVLHASFPAEDGSGFCLYDPDYPVIVVNTKQQTRGRRLFTLVHELAHILMHMSGISDPFIARNVTERRCNRFAGSFLVPKAYVAPLLKNVAMAKAPDPEDVLWASRRLKISQEASVLRLEQLGLCLPGSHAKWLALVKARGGNPDYAERGGGGNGQPPPQEKTKLAKYGFRFARVFGPLLSQRRISEINLYRSTGLKPAYQRAYFDYAKSITSSQLEDLELDDE